ncbi:MAG: lasso peptide biosynthesis B2 protein [Rudaea sp.]|uniref:lasso peptide biosynthesis B2 protein n=1 Tax=Rudaea sp. TaxID=2136325 RepID=UPI0039E5A33C
MRDDLSFCRVDDRLIFLDLQTDRYLRLSDRLERAFVASLANDQPDDNDIADLIRQRILTEDPLSGRPSVRPVLATRSAIELGAPADALNIPILLDAFVTVCSTQLQLAIRNLKTIIDRLVIYRDSNSDPHAANSREMPLQRLLSTVGAFRKARSYVPIETCCLLDALSLVKFLARRKLSANIVFGVTLDPFSAHCWVQAADWVLSDTVGNVAAHTPIRVV